METQQKILVIDDTEMFLEIESLFLARSGRVITACNGLEGLAIARAEEPDVIVTDLEMPGMAGDALCREIKRDPLLGDTPVIMVTPGQSARDHERAVRSGATDIIEKPVSRLTLIQAVNRLLRGAPWRGLTRIPMLAPVHIRLPEMSGWGMLQNLSRGGAFVSAPRTAVPETELGLAFTLPGQNLRIEPTARVVWQREASGAVPGGMGLQFLALDREGSRSIDDFVYERAVVRPGSAGAAGALAQ